MTQKGEKRQEKERKRKNKAEKQLRSTKAHHARKVRSIRRNNHRPEPIPPGYSTPVLNTFSFHNFFSDLTAQQRDEIAIQFGEEKEREFQESITQLTTSIMRHDPLELLATASFYCLLKSAHPRTDPTDDGQFGQHTIELIQSLCLQHTSSEFSSEPVLHHKLFEILNLSNKCAKAFGYKRFSALAETDPKKRNTLLAIEGARLNTQILRNWGYPQHVRKIVNELFEPLESDLASRIGIGPIAFFRLTDAMSETCENRALGFTRLVGTAVHENDLRKVVRAFCRIANCPDDKISEMLEIVRSKPGTLQEKKMILLSFFHHLLPDIFSFTTEDLLRITPNDISQEILASIIKSVSLRPGDLSQENPEHLVMQSKIQTKPIIATDDETYFIPIVGIFNGFIIDIVESWINPHIDIKKRYHRQRAIYLEDALKKLLDDSFPNAIVRSGVSWTDSQNGKTYENDCLVVCGPLAIVFEAKSERIDNATRRGGTQTLKNQYRTMVEAPAEQSSRLADILENGSGITEFNCNGPSKISLNLSTIRRAICVSVTLDCIPATTLSWMHLTDSGLVSATTRPSISMSLADLMVVLEALSSPTIRAHYFWRRLEWESSVYYLGDELDLLVYYLSSGLEIPGDLNETPPSFMLYGRSNELHRYYMAEWVGGEIVPPRPSRILSGWWLRIMQRLESIDKPERWDIACVLLDFSFDRQLDFEKHFDSCIFEVRRKGNNCEKSGLIAYLRHTESLGALVGFAYQKLSREERNERAANLADEAFKEAGAKRIVVIGCDIDHRDDPYGFLAFMDYSGTNCGQHGDVRP